MRKHAYAAINTILPRGLLVLGLLGTALPVVQAQPVPPPGKMPPPPQAGTGNIMPPLLQIAQLRVAEARLPVVLERLEIRSEIVGRTAVSRLEFVFRNPNERVLEGELQFPLLPGQSVTGFALDINGEMRPAVPVPKAKGQQVFEDVTRARVDPALLEVTQGNNYKLRVYPLPPQGTRRVMLEMTEILDAPPAGSGKKAAATVAGLQYRLPMQFASKIGHLEAAIHLADVPQTGFKARLVNLSGTPDIRSDEGGSWVVLSRKDYNGKGLLTLDLPATTASREAVVTTGQHAGQSYFYAEVPFPTQQASRPAPKHLALLWDASGSGASRDHGRELALLDACFKAIRETEVSLQVIRNQADAPRRFTIRNGDWHELRQVLETLPYDGATNLGAASLPAETDLALLFSDGLSNYGNQPFVPETRIPLYTINAGISQDATRLRHLAERTGGRYLDLLQQSAEVAVQALRTRQTRLLGLRSPDAGELVSGSVYGESGVLGIAGIMNATAARIELDVQAPDGSTQTRTVTVRPRQETQAIQATQAGVRSAPAGIALAARRWAGLKIAALEAEHERNRASITRLGMTFGLVTRETSLIVLDGARDYARYEIEPPATLREEYQQLLQQIRQAKKQGQQEHLEQIVSRFGEQVAWWEKTFPKGAAPEAVTAPESRRARRVRAMVLDEAEAGSVPPMPAPAPMMAAPVAASMAPGAPMAKSAGRPDAAAMPSATIQLKKWEPDAPYARRLREARPEDRYAIYLDERPGYLSSTAFFLDAADIFFERGETETGLRILSNLAEMNLENRHVLRLLGYRLLQAKQPQLALPVLEKVKTLSPDEPQSWRDLGLAYEKAGQPQQAIDALWEVVSRPWQGRFPDIELIALAELNAIVARHPGLDTQRMDSRLLRNLPLDLRVVLAWDADNTDIDLWVTDPNGEKVYYAHRLSYQGGTISRDFTGGYGPEAFSLRTAKPGKYRVQAQFYGHRQQLVAGATTLMLRLSTGFGTARQRDEEIMMRLQGQSEVIDVGQFEVRE